MTIKLKVISYNRHPLNFINCHNTLINPAMVTCYNYRKDSYFTLFCLELRDIGNIKEIEEGGISNKLGKEEP